MLLVNLGPELYHVNVVYQNLRNSGEKSNVLRLPHCKASTIYADLVSSS